MPGILDSPPSVFYEMVNFERAGLGWSKEQVRDYAQALIGKSDPHEFTPRDWMTLVYALRRLD